MSISPPTDIVLDVARAADPTRLTEAAAKLTRAKPGDAAAFASLIPDEPASPLKPAATSAATVASTGPSPQKPPNKAMDAFQRFEAMALATMLESAMPDTASVYGAGTAGNVWKSMMADELGKQMANAGGIGIASMLGRSAAAKLMGGSNDTGVMGADARSMIVSNAQRGALEGMRPANENESGSIFEDKA